MELPMVSQMVLPMELPTVQLVVLPKVPQMLLSMELPMVLPILFEMVRSKTMVL
jgi:hypothetical protein